MGHKNFYITTPIYYANSKPHLGHAYTTILADIMRNFYASIGYDTYFSTGTDEFGDKIAKAAAKAAMTPQNFTDSIVSEFVDLWPKLEVHPDQFIRTTSAKHGKIVTEILQKVYDNGDIYFDEYEGLYCVGCERFLGNDELVTGLCTDHQQAPTLIKEKNYFFKMSKYIPLILAHIQQNPDFIVPTGYRNEVVALLEAMVTTKQDLCISRPKSRLTWGIEIPFDPNKEFVTYVWFDALINYISLLDYPNGELFTKFWNAQSAHHLIAKDILRPHCIYWPAMLLSLGLQLPKQIAIHGYWLMDSNKMSKSLNNQVHPLEYAQKYGIDTFKYFLAKNMVFGKDSPFSHEEFLLCVNADLANNFGNLYSRVCALVDKNFDGRVIAFVDLLDSSVHLLQIELKKSLELIEKECYDLMMGFNTSKYCEQIMYGSSLINKFIDDTRPWLLAKKAKEDKFINQELGNVLRSALEGILVCAKLLGPIMPTVSKNILNELTSTGRNTIPADWKLPQNRVRFTRFLE